MKKMKALLAGLLTLSLLAAPLAAFGADNKDKEKKDNKAEYPLKTCVVSDEKLGDMGDPYVFKHEGKEVKLCCKSCKKDFEQNPTKYMKKIEDAQKKAAK